MKSVRDQNGIGSSHLRAVAGTGGETKANWLCLHLFEVASAQPARKINYKHSAVIRWLMVNLRGYQLTQAGQQDRNCNECRSRWFFSLLFLLTALGTGSRMLRILSIESRHEVF